MHRIENRCSFEHGDAAAEFHDILGATVRFRLNKTSDVVFFPFRMGEMERAMQAESMYFASNLDLNVWDAGEIDKIVGHNWGVDGQLVIFGHAGGVSPYKNNIYSTDNPRTATPKSSAEVAQMIADMGFPRGPQHEIVVWACNSGGVTCFTHMLTLHLTRHGYLAKRVYGCTTFSGTISPTLRLRAADGESSPRRNATAADTDYYIGAPPAAGAAAPVAAAAAAPAAPPPAGVPGPLTGAPLAAAAAAAAAAAIAGGPPMRARAPLAGAATATNT